MTLSFVIPELNIGGAGTPPLQFFRRGFNLGGSGSQPSWKDIILHGNTALTLVNAKANGINYVKLFGACEQSGTPTPTVPVDIVCNNGTLKLVDDELPAGYKRVLGYECNNNVLWQITDFKLRGSDTVRISFSIDASCKVFGCYQDTSATDNYDLYVSTTSGSKYLRYGAGTYLSYWSSRNLGRRFDVVFSPTGTSGMPQDSTWQELSFTSGNDLIIGSTSLIGTSSKLKGDLYGNIIVDNRLKLIPCERVSDGSLGYYDTYSETFYEPTGTPTSLGYDGSHTIKIGADGTTEAINIHGKNYIDVANYTIPSNSSYNNVWTGSLTGQFTLSVDRSQVTSVTNSGQRFVTLIVDGTTSYINYNACDSIQIDGTLTSISIVGSNAYAGAVGKVSLQLELGSTATEYEPYYNGGSATAEMLLKVGDYQDVQSVIDGEVTRKVGVKVLDGTESWSYVENSTNYGNFFNTSIVSVSSVESIPICNYFSGVATTYAYTHPSIPNKLWIQNNIRLRINAPENITTVAQFQQWLADQYNAGTPVIVVYPLAEPTTETVTAQPLTIQAGTNIVEITQASMDNLELEVSYKAGVEVTVTEIENAQLDNSVEVTVNG